MKKTDNDEEKNGRDELFRFKKGLISCLKTESLEAVLAEVRRFPPRQAVRPLLAGLFHTDDNTKWHAVSALGAVVAAMAERDMETARVIMRRLMWSLNAESGSIGWGAPEAMAEIMTVHEGLAKEYAHILAAYLRQDGCYLELPALQRGLMWGVGRLAGVRPDLLRKWDTPAYLPPYLDSEDPEVRGLAARASGILSIEEAKERLADLKNDPSRVLLYYNGELETTTVGKLAADALGNLAAKKFEAVAKDATELAAQTKKVGENHPNPLGKDLTLAISSLAGDVSAAAAKKNGDTVKAKLGDIKGKYGECHSKIRDKK